MREQLQEGRTELSYLISPSRGLLRVFKLVIKDIYDEKPGDPKKEIASLQRKLEDSEIRKSILMDLMLESTFSKDDFNDRNDGLTAAITDLIWTIADKRTTLIQLSSVIDMTFSTLQNIDMTWLNSDTETKRLIQRALFPVDWFTRNPVSLESSK